MNPHGELHLIFDKCIKNYDGEKTVSLTMLLGKLGICIQKSETRLMSLTVYKYNSKCVKDHNIRPEALKLVQERPGHIRMNRCR
jgi:hypothetical protein